MPNWLDRIPVEGRPKGGCGEGTGPDGPGFTLTDRERMTGKLRKEWPKSMHSQRHNLKGSDKVCTNKRPHRETRMTEPPTAVRTMEHQMEIVYEQKRNPYTNMWIY